MNPALIRVLLVDDDREDYVLAEEVFAEIETSRFELEWAKTYDAALNLIGQRRHDIYFLDYQLHAGRTGLDLLREALALGCTAPCVMLTGNNDPALDTAALQAGAADYIYKGHLEARLLDRTIRYCLERSQILTTLRRRNHELASLNQLTGHLNLFTHSVELFAQVPQLVRKTLGYECVSLWLDQDNELVLRELAGPKERPPMTMLVALPRQVWKTGRTAASPPLGYKGSIKEVATLAVPLVGKTPHQRIYGVLAAHDVQRAFQESDQVVLEALAMQITNTLERIQLFEAVEQDKRQLAAVLRGVADPVLVFNAEGQLQMLNPAGESLFNARQGKTLLGRALPSGNGYDPLLHLLIKAQQSQLITQGEVQWSNDRTFAVQITPINAGGQVVVLNDVTYFKELERAKNEFIAIISHDLRSPLSSISGFADLLRSRSTSPEGSQEYLAFIKQSIQRMDEMINSLLELTQINLQGTLTLETCDLNLVLTEIVYALQPQALNKEQTLALLDPVGSAPRDSIWVQANLSQLRRVAQNLVGNAIKYTPEQGTITVQALVQAQQVEVQIKDNGPGIPPSAQPFIFDRFYRVKNKLTKQVTGSGLGLAIVKAIVEQHGGRVWVESAGQAGLGTCFKFSLPLTSPELVPTALGEHT